VWGLGFEVSSFGLRALGFGFRVSGVGFRGLGAGFRMSGVGVGFRVSGIGFRVSGFGFEICMREELSKAARFGVWGVWGSGFRVGSKGTSSAAASERRGNNVKGIKDFCLKAKAIATRWSATLSSKVKLPHVTNLWALRGANSVTYPNI